MLSMLIGSRMTVLLAAVACMLGAFTVCANVGLLAASAWLISAAALHPPVSELSVAIVGVRFFGLARAICRYGERYVSHNVTFRLLADLRVWLYSRVEQLTMRELTAFAKGDIFSRLVADVETLQFFYLRAVFPVLIAVLVVTTVVILLAWLADWLIWPVLGLIVLTGCIVPIGMYYLGSKAGSAAIAARAGFQELLADSIEGITELAAFGQAKTQADKVLIAAASLQSSQKKANTMTVLADTVGVLGLNFTVLIVIGLAARQVADGQLNGVYLAVVALAVQGSFEAVLPLTAVVSYLRESAAAVARLKQIASKVSAVAVQGIAPKEPLTLAADKLSFSYLPGQEQVFSYLPGQEQVLTDISFCLPPGKKLAVVGASGAGKSTIAGLILRFWDSSQGRLLLNGKDIRQYAPEQVRKLISVVSQDTYLFNASIRDNILVAKPNAAPAELMAAVEAAGLNDFLAKLPQGLNTLTGQNGLALSGGERQRIALARALLKTAPVWLLDEPTAGLDAEAEQVVMNHILQAAVGSSMLLITHRLTGLEVMDEIIVLENGKVAEQGTCQQLLAARGLFYQMWTLQLDMLNIS
ncbi:MAG: putative multidrug export ATP-binding/permease protein [Firmicutes bacterium]|nr:putative multidrug export ATP-binding/permease protein [Bacillota bacterium]